MLDDSELRLGGRQGNMRVAAADFAYKKVKESGGLGEDEAGATKGGGGGKKGGGDKQKIIKKTQKLNKYALSALAHVFSFTPHCVLHMNKLDLLLLTSQ